MTISDLGCPQNPDGSLRNASEIEFFNRMGISVHAEVIATKDIDTFIAELMQTLDTAPTVMILADMQHFLAELCSVDYRLI
jgi:hypothetical protein